VFCYKATDPTSPVRDHSGNAKAVPVRRFHRKIESRTVVVTAAQNATPVHEGFLTALKAYCKRHSAELIVIPIRYKNPTSRWTASQANAEEWAEEVQPYLYNQRKKLNENLTLLADLKIQPTAVRPLTGLEGMTHAESGIVGHTKMQMVAVPTPHHALPKIMTTTGAVTAKNYTDSRAGKGGEFHHVYGAVVAEIESRGTFHLRHINARSDGAFIDLDRAYFPDGRTRKAPPYEALVLGDVHVRFIDPVAYQGTFGPGGMVELLNPKALVLHDLLDAYAVNPHHEGNPFIRLAKFQSHFDDVQAEVREAIEWVKEAVKGRQCYVVPSNHDDMLARWITRADWKQDPVNAAFYLETALQIVKSTRMGAGGAEYPDAFGYWLEQAGLPNVRALRRNESLEIAGIECGLHGDRGPHGARGTVKSLSRLGVKVISGHSHAPAIEEGHYRTGTLSRLQLEYNAGPSAWLHTHCSIDAFGKRHLHNLIGGRFTTRKG
jgi:hypothetical protein